jgi:glutaredoxin/glutathione-dependent peroxiredoxin
LKCLTSQEHRRKFFLIHRYPYQLPWPTHLCGLLIKAYYTDLTITRSLRLGSVAPNFTAETTIGVIDFHEWIGDKWAILFSHPEDYTPVCTTELAALAKYQPEFSKRGVKLIGLSANSIETHDGWINDISEIAGCALTFPVIGDKDRKIAFVYDM